MENKAYWKGVFYKTDGKWDFDNKIVEVKVEPRDEYTEILANWENEHDIVKLSPTKTLIRADKRPLIQIYIPGRHTINNFLGGNTWEQETIDSPTSNSKLVDDYLFFKNDKYYSATAVGNGIVPLGAAGGYVSKTSATTLYGSDIVDSGSNLGPFTLKETSYYDDQDPDIPGQSMTVVEISRGGTVYFRGESSSHTTVTVYGVAGTVSAGQTMSVYLHGQTDTYQRVLTNKFRNVNQTKPIPTEDIVADNRNYKYVAKIEHATIAVSNRVSVAPTKYGKRPDGLYYLPPTDSGEYYVVARGEWYYGSVWFKFPDGWDDVEPFFRDEYLIRDAYPLYEILGTLANMADSRLSFKDYADSTEYSHALNQIGELFVTPKSNIIAGEYSLAAQKGPATLKMFLDMLRDVYQLYWFIEDGKLRIEHIWWFKNGGTLSSSGAQVGYDLTEMKNTRNGKTWDFASSKIEFDKTEMPERYEFKWMDDVSDAFEGNPIEVKSRFVERSKVESITLANFTTDIDYLLLTPETASWDGFALINAEKISDAGSSWFYKIKYHNLLQNGQLSWTYLHNVWWLGDLPSRKVVVNEKLIDPQNTRLHIQRKRKQKVSFPSLEDPDPIKLVRTNFGKAQNPEIYGQIEKINVSLHSRLIKVDLAYDTE